MHQSGCRNRTTTARSGHKNQTQQSNSTFQPAHKGNTTSTRTEEGNLIIGENEDQQKELIERAQQNSGKEVRPNDDLTLPRIISKSIN